MELTKASGLPVARHELTAPVDEATDLEVQELLPGCPPDTVDRPWWVPSGRVGDLGPPTGEAGRGREVLALDVTLRRAGTAA
jgi:hypothetical protein